MTVVLAGIYTRISRDPEGSKLGVQRQEEDCRRLCASLGADVVGVWSDNDISASTKSKKPRPDYTDLLNTARRHDINLIASYSNSRLTRRPLELEELITLHDQHGTLIRTVVSGAADLSTADGRQYARIQSSIDAGEVERLSERVSRAKAQAAASGKYRGGPRPFGYDADGMTLRAEEAEWVVRAADAILEGRSLNSVVRMLNDAGIRTTRGAEWSPGPVRAMLLRPRNAALIGRSDNAAEATVPALWEPVLDEDAWRATVGILTDPARQTNAHNPGRERVHLGTGILICGRCGARMRRMVDTIGRASYVCKTSRHLTANQGHVDAFLTELVERRLARKDFANLLPESGNAEETAALRKDAEVLRKRVEQIDQDYDLGDIDAKRHKAATAVVEEKLGIIEGKLLAMQAGTRVGALLGRDPVKAWKAADTERRALILDSLATVTILPASRRGRPAGYTTGMYFDAGRIDVAWRTKAS